MEDNAQTWNLEIRVNDEDISAVPTLEFQDVPDTFDENALPTPSPSNSFTVEFSQPIRIRRLDVSAPPGTMLPTDMIIVPLQSSGEPFTDDAGNTVVLRLEDGIFDVPDDFVPVRQITFLVVSSDQPTPSISTEFLGCLHIGKNLAMNVGLWFHQVLLISANAFLSVLI